MTLNIVSPPPISWFRNPNLTELTPLTVTPEGRVYGHIAAWDQSHLSFPNRSIRPPRSKSDYRWFHTGSVDVVGDDGELTTISAGKISQGGGHAGLSLNAADTASYYDDSTSIVALICAFDEDPNGIAFSGALMADVDEVSVRRLKACGGVSGDWRAVGSSSGLEMVACLAVPTGGYAIPRARVASGAPLSLVAAGVLAPAPAFGRAVDPGWRSQPEQEDALTVNGGEVSNHAVPVSRIEITPAGEISFVRADEDQTEAVPDALTVEHAVLLAALDDTPTRAAALLAELDDTPDRVATLLASLADDDDVSDEDLQTMADLAADDGVDEEAFVSRMPPQLRRSYLTGKVAARIRWNTPGDMTRCMAQAKVHGMGRKGPGACALLHKAATGQWPNPGGGRR